MLDQLVAPTDADMAEASRELATALVIAQPAGCEVEAILPAGGDASAAAVPGIAGVRRTALARRELATALQMGVGTGIGGGMIHSPTLLAPLVRHDRVHDNDQTVVTMWDLRAWESPGRTRPFRPRLEPRDAQASNQACRRRCRADAHPFGALSEIAPKLGDRIRVIAGAAPRGFAVPSDEVGRRREMNLPEGFVLLAGGSASSDALAVALAAIAETGVDLPIVVIDVPEGQEPAVSDLAAASGIPERRMHLRGSLSAADRAAVFGATVALIAPARRTAFPWRVVDALALGVPVIAADSPVHREVVFEGGVLAEGADASSLAESLAAALAEAVSSASSAERLAVLSGDRGRAFSWREAADRVWQLHAEL